jgi:outer membrane protein OmpA-like peptidoglycan-associated protein
MRGVVAWIVSLAVVAGLLAPAAKTACAQGQPSASEIVDALKPKPATRGLTRSIADPGANAADQHFINSLRNKRTRSITVEERSKTAEIAKAKPSIDLEVTFDFDSAEIGAKGMLTLMALGTALRNPELKDQSFLVGGHTDAKGSGAYNQGLSERRAEAVKRFLVEKFGLQMENLIGIGFGKEQLKNKGDPFADENRRVQVVNLSAQ